MRQSVLTSRAYCARALLVVLRQLFKPGRFS
jgi:hypothetical protein